MQYKSIKGFSGLGQLGMLLIFLVLGLILAGLAQYIIGIQLIPAGTPMSKMGEEMVKAIMKPENTGYARLSQVLGTIFLLGLPVILYLVICHGKNPFWIGFNRHVNGWQILLGFFIIFIANVIAGPLADFSRHMVSYIPGLAKTANGLEKSYSEQVLALSNLKSWAEFFMALVIMAFIPAMLEELFFRGALQQLLIRWWGAPFLAILVTSLVFSLIHASIYLFLSRAVLGFVLGWMYYRSKNIWVNIVAHFLNNAVAVVQLFWLSQNQKKIELDKLDPKLPIWMGLAAVVILYGLFQLFERVSKQNKERIILRERVLQENGNIANHSNHH